MKTALSSLVELEYSRHRVWSPKSGPLIFWGIYIFLTAVGLWLGQMSQSLFAVVLAASILIVVATGYSGAVSCASLMFTAERDWWLSLPQPRWMIALSRVLASWLIFVRIAYLTGLAAATVLVLTQIQDSAGYRVYGHSLVSPNFLANILSLIVFIVACVPGATGLGISVLLFASGWRRALMGIPYGVIALSWLLLIKLAPQGHLQALQPLNILVAAGWSAVVGVPLLALVLFLAQKALPGLGKPSRSVSSWYAPPTSQTESTHSAQPTNRVDSANKAHLGHPTPEPLWLSLVKLEWTRFRWLGRSAPSIIRGIAWLCLILLFAGGFVAAYWSEPMIGVSTFVCDFTSMFAIIFATSSRQVDAAKSRLVWTLALPHKRIQVNVLTWASQVSALFAYSLLGWLALGAGIFLHVWFLHPSHQPWAVAVQYWTHAVALSLAGTVIMTMVFMVTPAFYVGWRAIFLIPLYGAGYNGVNWLFSQWIMSDPLLKGPAPHFWLHFASLVIIGVPLGIACLRYGSRHLHNYLTARTIKRWGNQA